MPAYAHYKHMDPSARIQELEQSHDDLRALLRLCHAALDPAQHFVLREKIETILAEARAARAGSLER
jgi:hypothetical protein